MNTRGMWIGTFHGLCNRMLRAHYRDANLPQLFQILDTQDQLALIKRMYRAHNIDDERYPARQLQWFIAAAKEQGLRPNAVEAGDEFTRRQVEHYALYDATCQREGVVDFAELLLRSYELLVRQRGHPRALPAPLLAPPRRRVPGHQRAAVQVAAPARRARSTAVFAVGDDDQSIYAFRGANVANMQHFERDFGTPELPVKLIKLEQNYRSHGHILDAANALIQNNQTRLGKNLWTDEGKGEPVRAFVGADRPRRGRVHRRRREGRRRRRRRRSTRSRCSIAATRSRACSSTRCSTPALPYRVYGGMRFFERAEIKHALAYLRLIATPDDDGAFLRVVNFPPRGIGARTLEQLQDQARGQGTTAVAGRVRRRARRQGGQRRVAAFVQADRSACAPRRAALPLSGSRRARHRGSRACSAHYRNEKDGQDRIENLEELVNAAASFVREAELAVDAPMLTRIASTPRTRSPETGDDEGATDPLTAFLAHARSRPATRRPPKAVPRCSS